MKNGFLLVIDGIDGSGKTTQVDLLTQYFQSQNIVFEVISFPRYGDNLYADLVQKYLQGEFGKIGSVDSHFIALAYAGDRFLAKTKIEKWLSEGKLVICNRYVSASKAHLGANIDIEERKEFINWIDKLEYQTNGMPKEDLAILLAVEPRIGQKNAIEENLRDIHEQSATHLSSAAQIYLSLAKGETNWVVVNCMENDKMSSREKIQQQIREIVDNKLWQK